ncbi:iron-sulfur cluster carrier protein ApbC [Celerinatantimonas yamalensis]|uniref:Iron-sulfur cluster carrier protein n=1 Tax=Celerinatantimonas yamalensis TaxID=559956 RepID=A0ABW9G448_9GAMM
MENQVFQFRPEYWVVTIGESGWLKQTNNAEHPWLFAPPFACPSVHDYLQQALGHVEYQPQVSPRALKGKHQTALAGVKNMLAVSSAKGGVGKSSVTVNLATALAASGARVGILDADIYGPSIPLLLGLEGQQPTTNDGKTMEPLYAHQLFANSIGFLQPPEEAAIWRGPMASKALLQLLQETNWPDLDYLFIDMPPGTGDIQLTMAQQMPVTASLVVTTPQALALRDAHKGISMFHHVEVPVLGIIENMSYYTCPSCDQIHYLFGQNGGEMLAKATQLPILAQLPFDSEVNSCNENGHNLQQSGCASALLYRQLAEQIVTRLYFDSSARAEPIAVEVL